MSEKIDLDPNTHMLTLNERADFYLPSRPKRYLDAMGIRIISIHDKEEPESATPDN